MRRRWQAAVPSAGFRIDPLEPRTLLAFAPAGGEFRVNTTTADDELGASVAVDADGDFIVAWERQGEYSPSYGIYAQRYNAAGVAQGGEFRVNTTTNGWQFSPSVAVDADGDFVIAWENRYQDGRDWGIFAQRYNAAGVPQGGEFLVNTFTAGDQRNPSVASDAKGDFVVAWTSYQQDGSGYGVYAQRYDAAGVAQGGEFRVNTTTSGDQHNPSVASDADGDFVVTWQSYGQDGSKYGVYARRYDAAGTAEGGEFGVNATTDGDQTLPSVAIDTGGDFVVAWESVVPDGSGYDVYAQRYDAAGVAQGGEFLVNTVTPSHQRRPSVTSDADGDFVVAWESMFQDGSGYGVYARRYDATGAAQGGEFLVNTFTVGQQRWPSVASDAEGDFVVAWSSDSQDGSGWGVYAQRYVTAPPPAAPKVTQVFANGQGLTGQTTANGQAFRAMANIDNTFGYPIPTGTNQLKSLPWVNGINAVSLRFDQDVASQLQQGDLVVRGVNTPTYTVSGFSYDAATKTGTWTFSTPITNDKVRLFLDDALLPGLDGEWADSTDTFPSGDGSAGGDFAFRFNVLRGDATQDGRVNALDLSFIKQRLNKTATNPGTTGAVYSVFADLTGDGSVNALDLSAARARLNNALPTGEPATALLFSTRAISR